MGNNTSRDQGMGKSLDDTIDRAFQARRSSIPSTVPAHRQSPRYIITKVPFKSCHRQTRAASGQLYRSRLSQPPCSPTNTMGHTVGLASRPHVSF